MADQPNSKNYHNDAAKAPKKKSNSCGSVPKTSKKDRKMAKLQELACKLESEKAEMADQLKKLQAEMETMKSGRNISSTPDKDVVEQDSVDFATVPCASSTRQARTVGSAEESRFLCSVNQLSVSSITIPECKPVEGDDEIHRRTYEMWRDLLIDSLTLAGIEDEMTKFIVFKVKAGSRLLSIFKNTKSDDDAPDAAICPFSNALHRLKLYFGSGSDVMFQRRKLSLMEQRSDESDLAFITRVGDTAQLCDYDKAKEFEEIIKTVAEHAKCKEVRVTALKMVSRNGTFTDLVDKIREIQAIRMNEEFFEAKYGQRQSLPKEAMLAPLRVDFPKQWTPRRNFTPRGGGRYVPYSRNNQRSGQVGWRSNRSYEPLRGNSDNQNAPPRSDRCWRCLSYFHLPSGCGAANLVCRKCGQLGHIQRACESLDSKTKKRVATRELSEIEAKHSKTESVEENTNDTKPEEQVSD